MIRFEGEQGSNCAQPECERGKENVLIEWRLAFRPCKPSVSADSAESRILVRHPSTVRENVFFPPMSQLHLRITFSELPVLAQASWPVGDPTCHRRRRRNWSNPCQNVITQENVSGRVPRTCIVAPELAKLKERKTGDCASVTPGAADPRNRQIASEQSQRTAGPSYDSPPRALASAWSPTLGLAGQLSAPRRAQQPPSASTVRPSLGVSDPRPSLPLADRHMRHFPIAEGHLAWSRRQGVVASAASAALYTWLSQASAASKEGTRRRLAPPVKSDASRQPFRRRASFPSYFLLARRDAGTLTSSADMPTRALG